MSHLAYARKKENDWATGGSAPSTFTGYGVLFTTAPADDGSGYVEPLGANGYARLTGINAKFAAATTDGSKTNTAVLQWAAASAPWLDVIGWGIADSATIGAGNIIRYIVFDAKKSIGTGDTLTIDIGAATLR